MPGMCEISVEGPISVIFETKQNNKRNDIKFHIVSFISVETIWNLKFFRIFFGQFWPFFGQFTSFLANFGHFSANFGHFLANFSHFLANFGHFSANFETKRNDITFHIFSALIFKTIWNFISFRLSMPKRYWSFRKISHITAL